VSFEAELYEQRKEKMKQIEALGYATYPNSFAFTHTVAQVLEGHGNSTSEALAEAKPPVLVSGRLSAIRRQGKAGFCDVVQAGQRIQVYVRKEAVGDNAFELYKLLDLGDSIGIAGYVFRTRTGELSIHAEQLTFLAKALLPMPEKWHGLQEVEARYRQRYLDLLSNAESRNIFLIRARVIQALRAALDREGYIEVETPMMQPMPGGALARPFVTHHNALDLTLYLRIAPELYLKRLIVGGMERVYEISRVFRNEGISTRHNPEYTMLEFYQAYAEYRDLMNLTERLIAEVARTAIGGTVIQWGEEKIDLAKWNRYSLREAICAFWPDEATRPKVADFNDARATALIIERWNRMNPGATPVSMPVVEMTPAGPASLGHTAGVPLGNAVLHLFEAVCEKHLTQPTIIYDFPVEVSPLAKNKPDEPGYVERFEAYIGGMEILNAYSELNDPEEQRKRFLMQVEAKERGDQETHPIDEDYVRALSYGMPPTAGEGIGIDRLVMLLTGSRSIRDVILFPLMRPEATEVPPSESTQ
jgi:lysyl-tRNA synthetase, class II